MLCSFAGRKAGGRDPEGAPVKCIFLDFFLKPNEKMKMSKLEVLILALLTSQFFQDFVCCAGFVGQES